MISLLLAVAPLALGLAQAQGAGVHIAVDVSQADGSVAQQVTYRRGEVLEFDNPTSSPSDIVARIQGDVQNAGLNLITAAVNLNSNADKQYFDYSAGPPMSLTPDLKGTDTLVQTFSKLRQAFNANQLPAVIQLSGTPSVLPPGDLDPNYAALCNDSGNFYPLPSPGKATSLVQSAIGDWIDSVSKHISGAIWIGTQEPTHTLGYSTKYQKRGQNCSDPDHSERQNGTRHNIDRFISYWNPIARPIRSHNLESGGIQLNSGDTTEYGYAVQQIISAGMPLDYLTIQDYSPSVKVVQAINAAWKKLRSQPGYRSVKVILDRSGLSLGGANYNIALGMVQYLIFESQLMQYADMFYGYAIQVAALHPSAGQSLLPVVLKWLQGAPAPLRPFTSSNNDVQGFALVRKSGSPLGSIAIWNKGTSSTPENVSLTLTDYPKALSSANVTILKGSGTAVRPYHNATIKNNSIGGLSLARNEFFLIGF